MGVQNMLDFVISALRSVYIFTNKHFVCNAGNRIGLFENRLDFKCDAISTETSTPAVSDTARKSLFVDGCFGVQY